MTLLDRRAPDGALATSAVPAGAVRIGLRTGTLLAVATLAGLAMFCWPLLAQSQPGIGHATDAPLVFVVVLPLLLAIVLAQFSEGGMDAKALAVLGVLSAVNAALRPTLGAGTAGIESVFFLLVLAGRVFGPGFGFVLGCTSLFSSALLTAGIGPWLPFQMLASAWIGLGAGLLPRRVRGRAEIAMLVAYGIVAAYAFGLLMNLWFWPFALGIGAAGDGSVSFVPGAPLLDNVHRFLVFTLISSTGGWDTGRAITTTVAIIAVGPAVLAVLRRASRRASFGP